MKNQGVLFSPVICYNINGIIDRGENVSSRFLKLQAGVLISRHSPGLDTHVVRRDYFFYCFFCFHRFFSFVFRITIYVTNNKGRNVVPYYRRSARYRGQSKNLRRKKEEVAELKCLSRVRFFFPS